MTKLGINCSAFLGPTNNSDTNHAFPVIWTRYLLGTSGALFSRTYIIPLAIAADPSLPALGPPPPVGMTNKLLVLVFPAVSQLHSLVDRYRGNRLSAWSWAAFVAQVGLAGALVRSLVDVGFLVVELLKCVGLK